MFVNVKGQRCLILKEFPVLHRAWECDPTGWIVEHDGKKALVLTSHGGAYFANKSELIEKLEEYHEAINETQEALDMIL